MHPYLIDKPTLELEGKSWPAVIPQILVSDILSFYRAIFLSTGFAFLSALSLEEIKTAMEGRESIISKRNPIFVHCHQTGLLLEAEIQLRWSSLGLQSGTYKASGILHHIFCGRSHLVTKMDMLFV